MATGSQSNWMASTKWFMAGGSHMTPHSEYTPVLLLVNLGRRVKTQSAFAFFSVVKMVLSALWVVIAESIVLKDGARISGSDWIIGWSLQGQIAQSVAK
jgi:hypothetical protein